MFQSCLSQRVQYVRLGQNQSNTGPVQCGVPQSSVLGPILFLLYTADLQRIIQHHAILPHFFADDVQIYGFIKPSEVDELQCKLSLCTDDVASFMCRNRLQLNTSKTELIWFSSQRRQHLLPSAPVCIGSDLISPSRSVRDLGIFLDSNLSMKTHVKRTVSSCFGVLRQLRSIRRSVTSEVMQQLVVSLVLSRLDYGNATLAGLPAYLLQQLQSVMNAGARLIYGGNRFDHITIHLKNLHWLRASERITYKIAILAYQCLRGNAPDYLAANLLLNP